MQIRKSTIADLPAIQKLYLYFESDPSNILSPEDAEKQYLKIASYPNYVIYVAVLDEQIVGTFSLLIMDQLVHAGTPSGIVDAVIVDPAYQHQGIGKHMMKFAMNVCVAAGCYKLALSSNYKWDVKGFYEGLGFEAHGTSFHIHLCETIF